jgi:release factor glutamine methyltransferase
MISSRDLLRESSLPPHEAIRLLSLATNRNPGEVRAGFAVDDPELARFSALTGRRLSGEPMQYLEGEVSFGPVTVVVDSRVLIPRPETEYLYEVVARTVVFPRIIADLCTGSGALALALKHRFPQARVVGCDLSAEALSVASANGYRLGLDVEFRLGDLWDGLPSELSGQIDLVVANPPYVSETEWEGLAVDVRREPRVALVAGPIGTEVIERLVDAMATWLAPGGVALVEVGETQAVPLAEKWGFEVLVDQFDRPRFLRTSRPIASG